jgi:hypothetical protein
MLTRRHLASIDEKVPNGRLADAIAELCSYPADWRTRGSNGPIAQGVPANLLWELFEAATGELRVR